MTQNLDNFQFNIVEIEVENDETLQVDQNNDIDSECEVISESSENETEVVENDELCYVLVDMNGQINNHNINSSGEGTVIASGVDVAKLINEAKCSMELTEKTQMEPPKRVRRVWRAARIGDCKFEDMEDPLIRKNNWELALRNIKDLRKKNQILSVKNRRLQQKLDKANAVIKELNKRK